MPDRVEEHAHVLLWLELVRLRAELDRRLAPAMSPVRALSAPAPGPGHGPSLDQAGPAS
jgi:hypothetical protein